MPPRQPVGVSVLALTALLAVVPPATPAAQSKTSTAAMPARLDLADETVRTAPPASVREINAASVCQDVVVVGARGSGQQVTDNGGLGPEVKNASDELTSRLPGYRVGWYSIPYTAAYADFLIIPAERKRFFASLEEGVKKTEEFLPLRSRRCPKERYVLAGYSQGAMVMHRIVYRLSRNKTTSTSATTILPRIVSVLAIADGDKQDQQGGLYYGTAGISGSGATWGAPAATNTFWPSPTSAKIPTSKNGWYSSRFMSICWKADTVCDWTGAWNKSAGVERHVNAYKPRGSGKYAGLALNEIRDATSLAAGMIRKNSPPQWPALITQSLSSGMVGAAYTTSLTGYTHAGQLRWSRTSGTLPPGLELASTGTITGTPLTEGTWSFAITAINENGLTDSRAYRLVVSPSITIRPTSKAQDAAAGTDHSCALIDDGTVKCWGSNGIGQLGIGVIGDQLVPVAVSGLSGVTQIAAGGDNSCALIGDGTVKCWGRNQSGQLGDGTRIDRWTPVAVSGLSGVTQIAAGSDDSCALIGDGTVRCWGRNQSGQLGDGTSADRLTPVAVSGLNGVTQITVGGGQSCALLGDGTVKCWGVGYSFMSPEDGTMTGPVEVSGLGGVTQVAAGESHACALLGDGAVRCWGDNGLGQVGDGTYENRWTPVSPIGLNGVTQITAHQHRSCALLRDGTVTCWGSHRSGQLGDQTGGVRSAPVSVTDFSDVTSVTTGADHSCAVRKDGAVSCWGYNEWGQLGDGTSAYRATPVAVISLDNPY